MKLHFLAAFAAVSLAACAGSSRPIVLPNGDHATLISCSGMNQSMASCYLKAEQVCPLGYDIVTKGGESQPANTNGNMAAGNVADRTLTVKCR